MRHGVEEKQQWGGIMIGLKGGGGSLFEIVITLKQKIKFQVSICSSVKKRGKQILYH